MNVDEELVRRVFLAVSPGDLERVLTTIEGYRTCVAAWQKLRRTRRLRQHLKQLRECAESCEEALADYAASGRWTGFEYPPGEAAGDLQHAHLVVKVDFA